MKTLASQKPEEAVQIIEAYLKDPIVEAPYGLHTIPSYLTLALAATDPDRAFEQLESSEESLAHRTQSTLQNTLMAHDPERIALQNTLMAHDPERVASIYLAKAAAQGSTRDLERIVTRWASEDPTQAIEWVQEKVGDPDLQTVLQDALTFSSTSEAHEMYQELLLHRTDSPTNRNLTKAVASTWARRSPMEAAGWAEGVGDPALFETAVNAISREWLRQDSLKASEWIADLPAGTARDKAVHNLIESIEESDPVAADEWRKLLNQ